MDREGIRDFKTPEDILLQKKTGKRFAEYAIAYLLFMKM